MTILETKLKLYDWFEKNHSFEIERDAVKFLSIVEEPEACRAAVLIALKEFVNIGFAKVETWEDKEYYILEKPLDSYEQTVTLNSQTARYVSEMINTFCEVLDDRRDVCDPLGVREKDIQNLCNIITMLKTPTSADDVEPI